MSVESIFRIDNKVAVVTGGSRGLGLYMAEGFILAGASKVIISSRKGDACQQAADALNKLAKSKGLKGVAIPIAADAATEAGIKHLHSETLKHTDKVDILIANAGATWGESLETHPDKAFSKVLELNIKGVFQTIQHFTPQLEASGTAEDPSRVVITGSTAGIIAGLSGGTYGYVASKAGVAHLGKVLACELGPRNITVNILAPGFFPSKMSNGLLEQIGESAIANNPRGRLGVKEDIIGATLYLVSKAGNYVNGLVLPVDGGIHLTARM